jgi:hypothetical protein
MSCTGLYRLYPKRSIASHRFCGSGRLFPGFEGETIRESMTGLGCGYLKAQECKRPVMLSSILFRSAKSDQIVKCLTATELRLKTTCQELWAERLRAASYLCAIAVHCHPWIFRVV